MDHSNQYKARPYLLTRSLMPENQETPIQFIKNDIIDNKLFYRRNHVSYPTLSYSNYWLPINGTVSKPILLSMYDNLQLPSKTIQIDCFLDSSLLKLKISSQKNALNNKRER